MLHIAAAIVCGVLMAIFLGQAAAQGSMSKIGMILAMGPILFLVLGLQQKVWLIIPFLSSFEGSIPFIPIPFAVRELAILASFGIFLFLAVFKKLPARARYENVDLLLLLNLLYLVSVYMRNPVGFNAFGSELVGGRPYFMVVIACMFYWVYTHVSVGPKLIYALPLISLSGSFVTVLIWAVSYFVPGATPVISKFYTGVDFSTLLAEYRSGPGMEQSFSRFSEVSEFGFGSIMCLIAYYRPLTVLSPMYFWRFVAFCGSSLALLMGGFRSQLFKAGLYFLTICYLRGGLMDVFKATILGICGIVFVMAIQVSGLIPLPVAVQRSLSAFPIPIEWDYRAVSDAKTSSSWRYEMWKEVWESDKWIKNRILGDGFGFTRYELTLMQSELLGTGGFMEGGSEASKIQGAFHNGPLSAIRYVGTLGLILYLILAFTLAKKAVSLIKMTRGTPFQPASILQVGVIFAPVLFIFVFGQYNAALPQTIYSLAVFKLISRSYRDYTAAKQVEETAQTITFADGNRADTEEPARIA